MYKSSLERLKEISQKISAIFEICGDDIDASLSDEMIIQPAIMMPNKNSKSRIFSSIN